ncbi:MAG: hypothetical protein V4465_03120 [Patescibacteria group bacterium]
MKKIQWTKVTWYSKLATILLLMGAFPALAFYIGTQYEETMTATTYLADEISL